MGSSVKTSREPVEYLRRVEDFSLRPTFWTSAAYLSCLDLVEIQSDGKVWLEEDGRVLFPPITQDGLYDTNSPEHIWAIPATCYLNQLPPFRRCKFLDWEYLYRPSDFQDLSGGKWKVFRKNVRKWPNANPGCGYESIKDWTGRVKLSVFIDLIVKWLEGKPDIEIEDSEVIMKYLERMPGQAFGLFKKDKLVGVNIWDYSWMFVNFRYSFSDPEEPYLSEFLRLLFYQSQTQMVNDGGSLGNPNLERFKDKLNPYRKSKIYSKGF